MQAHAGVIHLNLCIRQYFAELRIVSGSLPQGLRVKNTCSLGAFDENAMGGKVTVSELDHCFGQETAYRGTCCIIS